MMGCRPRLRHVAMAILNAAIVVLELPLARSPMLGLTCLSDSVANQV
jgi:hypothetical protein